LLLLLLLLLLPLLLLVVVEVLLLLPANLLQDLGPTEHASSLEEPCSTHT
jgi:hypothetical protein